MNVTSELLEKSMAKLTIEVEAEKVEEAVTKAYHKIKNKINVPGFRKGKVPQKMIEKMYGAEVFYEDAADILMGDSYPKAYDECGLEIESTPKVEIVQIEKGKPFIYTATVAVKPEVKLGNYKGIEYSMVDTNATEADIDEELEKVRRQNSRRVPVEDRPTEKDDIVDIDYVGTVDGVEFEGGSANGYNLTLGSGTFIPGFEDQLIGHNIGDEVEVIVTFPEDYGEADLAGKEAHFACKINEIKAVEMPALDDEFASEVSEFDTLDEYREELRKEITERKKDRVKSVAKNEIISKIVEDSEVEVPDAMLDYQAGQKAREFEQQLASQGMSMDMYLSYLNLTPEQFLDTQVKPAMLKEIKETLVTEAIVKAEGIEATDEEAEAEIKDMADAYGMEVDKLKEMYDEETMKALKHSLALKKATELVYENGVAVPLKEEDIKPADDLDVEETKDAESGTEAAAGDAEAELEPATEEASE